MTLRWEDEAPRLAVLARLRLTSEEAVELARACEAITRDFSDLERYAASLPAEDVLGSGGLREDRVEEQREGEPDAILAAAPRVDAASRSVLVPRGGP